jgi:transposase
VDNLQVATIGFVTCIMQHITGTDRHQTTFTSLDDLIAPDNRVRIIDAFVEKLDMQQMKFQTNHKSEGRPPFHPKVFLKLYLYGYMNSIRSSRKLESECIRNKEVCWLINELTPNYHSIADFRKVHSTQIKFVFRALNEFLKDNDCFGKTTVAIDGTKIRAQNATKNNFNEKKVLRHLAYLDGKMTSYLEEMNKLDQAEEQTNGIVDNKLKIKEKLQQLKERKISYENLQKKCEESIDGQVSTTDTDAKAMIHRTNVVAVSYNVQATADDKHCLVVDYNNTNKNDSQALAHAAKEAKRALDIPAEESLTVLNDKGYHNGSQIHECEQNNIITVVAYKEQAAVKHLAKEFLVSAFIYNNESDTYTCPAGQTLTTIGTLHNKKKEDGETSYRFKKYTTPACQSCPLKEQCTKLKSRAIERSEYQEAVDRNNHRVRTQRELYNKRQETIEHIFGTIKRPWGYTYTLLKGLKKVDGEMGLIFTAYNLRRSMTIFGVEELLTRLNEWKGPDYTKLKSFAKADFTPIEPFTKEREQKSNHRAPFILYQIMI